MRAGLSTIQQTLTPDAAAVLTRSTAEAARRSHGQTTPLHVAATLLSAPSGGVLRRACLQSHPVSSQPLQCRALELCFSVALDRLPSSTAPIPGEPPISNALMAALKRAQAHQRRGSPEQQQQPLLAVKVELHQLVISILDDPSVSRVMREASFSSPAVKAAIEQSIAPLPNPNPNPNPIRTPSYINPRLHHHTSAPKKDESNRVLDIMLRPNKRNPVLVADSDPIAVMREALSKISNAAEKLSLARVIKFQPDLGSDDQSQLVGKIRELGGEIELNIGEGEGGVIVDLGDLKWLVEGNGGGSGSSSPIRQQIVSEGSKAAVVEMGKLVGRFAEKVWLVGAATCATYLRCQVYHPTMESEWDLQAVPVAPRSAMPSMFPRIGGNGILSSSVESLAPMKGFSAPRRLSESSESAQRTTLCTACKENYERELAKLVSSKTHSKPESRQALPHWLQLANPGSSKSPTDHPQSKENGVILKQSSDELLKRWHNKCSRLHPALVAPGFPMPPADLQPKLMISRGSNHQAELLQSLDQHSRRLTPPESSVKTDLVLGHSNPFDARLENAHSERIKDLAGCTNDGFSSKIAGVSYSDSDSFKKLLKGLVDKVGWQPEAASAVAAVVMQSKSGSGKLRGLGPKSDTWLLFIGPDKVGKKKMVSALSELLFGIGPITIHLAGASRAVLCEDSEFDVNFRGKTAVDRIAEAVRRNPHSLIVLEGIDRAETLVKASIKRAIERGRLHDSQGREVSLGSVTFVLTTDWLPEELKSSHDSGFRCEEQILDLVNSGWQLELSSGELNGKRRFFTDLDHRPTKLRKESPSIALSLDLNLSAGVEEDTGEGSRNSSDVTVEHEQEGLQLAINCTTPSPPSELMELVDEAVIFKPVDFLPLRRKIIESISTKFTAVMGNAQFIRVDDEALDRLVGGVWLAGAGVTAGLEEWAERVFVPSLQQLKSNQDFDGPIVVRLSTMKGGRRQQGGSRDWLPAVAIAGDYRRWAIDA